MKLKQLMNREMFPEIFESSLGDYLTTRTSWEGKIVWGKFARHGATNLLANSELNLIFPVSCDSRKLTILAAEYAFNENLLKRLLQGLYIKLSVLPLVRYLFSSYKLHITNLPVDFSNICILPGNNTIRIVDFDADECVVILKKGFDAKKFKNTILVRSTYADIPGPKIKSYNLEEGWYREEKIVGLPANRVQDQLQRKAAVDETKLFLAGMYSNTRVIEEALSWRLSKFQDVDEAISVLPTCIDKLLIKRLYSIKILLFGLFDSNFTESEGISTALTHGDLQDANLLIPAHDRVCSVYVIDWEYAGKRCSHYDWFVYGLLSRSPKGLMKRIHYLLNIHTSNKIQFDWYDFSSVNQNQLKKLIILFLMDDFLFRLHDANRPGFGKTPDGLEVFLDEVQDAAGIYSS
jgi:hypothetical protein